MKDGEVAKALTSQEFADAKYYNRFSTLFFDAFMQQTAGLLQKQEIQVVLGIGQPEKMVLEQMKVLIPNALKKAKVKQKNFILRLERRSDIEAWQNTGCKIPILYHPVPGKRNDEELEQYYQDAVAYCKSHKIKRISVSPDHCNESIVKLCKAQDMKLYVFTSFRGAGMVDALKMGADYVSNHYYDVDYMKRLTQS